MTEIFFQGVVTVNSETRKVWGSSPDESTKLTGELTHCGGTIESNDLKNLKYHVYQSSWAYFEIVQGVNCAESILV